MPKTNPRKEKAKNQQLTGAVASVAMASKDDESDFNGESAGVMWKKVSDAILKTINYRFDKFEMKFESLQSSQNKLAAPMDSMDDVASDHESHLMVMEKTMNDLKVENTRLQAKVNDLEGRSRRNNIKIPEGEEKGTPTEFICALIPKLLGESHFQKPVIINCAHRTQQPKPAEGARPRTFIARVHHYQEKEMIIRLGRQQTLEYNGQQVLIFPDYTAEVMEQRSGFHEVMQDLREMTIKHSLRFPAKLHLQHNGQQRIFTSPGEAKRFVDKEINTLDAGKYFLRALSNISKYSKTVLFML